MSFSNQLVEQTYTIASGNRQFVVPFYILQDDTSVIHVQAWSGSGQSRVFVNDLTFTINRTGGSYSVTIASPSGALADGQSVRVYRQTPAGQPTSFPGSTVSPESVEAGLDRIAMQSQEIEADLRRDIATGELINEGSIGEDHLDDGAVTTAKISDMAVTEQKIAARAVTTSKIGDGSVTTVKIQNEAVIKEKLSSAVSTQIDNSTASAAANASAIATNVTNITANRNAAAAAQSVADAAKRIADLGVVASSVESDPDTRLLTITTDRGTTYSITIPGGGAGLTVGQLAELAKIPGLEAFEAALRKQLYIVQGVDVDITSLNTATIIDGAKLPTADTNEEVTIEVEFTAGPDNTDSSAHTFALADLLDRPAVSSDDGFALVATTGITLPNTCLLYTSPSPRD